MSTPEVRVYDSFWALLFVIAPVVQLLDALSKQSWRLAAHAKPEGSFLDALIQSSKARWLYTAGLLLLVSGAALDLVGNNLAPAAIVSSISGALAIIWLIMLSPCLLGERLTTVRMACAAVLVVGTLLMGAFAPHDEIAYTGVEYLKLCARPSAIAFYVVLLTLLVGTLVLARHVRSYLLFSIVAGLLVGQSWLMKIASVLIGCAVNDSREACSGPNPIGTWEFWFFFLLVAFVQVGGNVMLAVALRGAEALDAVAAYQGTCMVNGAIASAAVLNEQSTNSTTGVVLYFMSVALVAGAVGVLCLREASEIPANCDRELACACYDKTAAKVRQWTEALVGMAPPEGEQDAAKKGVLPHSELTNLMPANHS
uniref:Magnesium transporter n=1 Tax=Haptolina brevifila TaxID=156173 RepID=A0A7S2MDP1_9EUKA|mmetsp:Transcript_49889/g.99283  ORF Transcript_49889/g.99283 Transcript_49889/m.99283 type:complete len:369 (+) Transcript_49889:88-1194(+)